MARNRNKVYKQGDRINIYLSRDLTPEFVDWINKQSDLSNFFLYAAQQLYEKTGFVDVSEVMPRKINFDLPGIEALSDTSTKIQKEEIQSREEMDKEEIDESEEKKETDTWASLDDLDDPYA